MQKKIALMFFIIAVMMSVIGFGEQNIAHAAAARYTTIYDGTVQNLIASMNKELDAFNKILPKENYYHCKNHQREHCYIYLSSNKQSYLIFDLNDNNSVISAYFVWDDVRYVVESKQIDKLLYPIISFGYSIGMKPKDWFDMWSNLSDYFERINETEYVSFDKTVYGYCAETNKNIYMRVKCNSGDNMNATFYFGLANNQ